MGRRLWGKDRPRNRLRDLISAGSEVVEEAYGLVTKGLINQDDFRAFMFTNAARLFTGANPRFFEGTCVSEQVRAEMGLAEAVTA